MRRARQLGPFRVAGFLLSRLRRDDERPRTPQTRTARKTRASHAQPPRHGKGFFATTPFSRGEVASELLRGERTRGGRWCFRVVFLSWLSVVVLSFGPFLSSYSSRRGPFATRALVTSCPATAAGREVTLDRVARRAPEPHQRELLVQDRRWASRQGRPHRR